MFNDIMLNPIPILMLIGLLILSFCKLCCINKKVTKHSGLEVKLPIQSVNSQVGTLIDKSTDKSADKSKTIKSRGTMTDNTLIKETVQPVNPDEFLTNIYKLYKTKEQECDDIVKELNNRIKILEDNNNDLKGTVTVLEQDNEKLRTEVNQYSRRRYYDECISVYVSASGRKLHHNPNCIKFTDKSSITLYPLDKKLYNVMYDRFDIICSSCP